MTHHRVFTGLLIACVIASASPAATWHVPAAVSTIGEALFVAAPGDSVIVAPGTYQEFGLMVPSGVTLIGTTGNPVDVIVDAQMQGGVMAIPESAVGVVVEGLTLRNGSTADRGGGLAIAADAEAVIRRCKFTGNSADVVGGALAATSASLVVEDCRFVANASQENGSAVAIVRGEAQMNDCTIIGNQCGNYGIGAVYVHQGAAILTRCTVESNLAWSGSGLAASVAASLSLFESAVTGNKSTSDSGGGVDVLFNSDFEAYETTFENNVVGDGYVGSDCSAFLYCCESAPDLWLGDGFVIFDDYDCSVVTQASSWSDVRGMFRR